MPLAANVRPVMNDLVRVFFCFVFAFHNFFQRNMNWRDSVRLKVSRKM